MANRSSLELMLERIQHLEDQPKDIPPALPIRPVSRARLPLARRPLRFDFQKRNSGEENYDGSFNGGCIENKRTKKDDYIRAFNEDRTEIVPGELDRFQKGIVTAEKRSYMIQKWYRGHRVRRSYKELKRGALALQSFVRGENVRRNYYEHRRKKLGAIFLIQKQLKNYFKNRVLLEQGRAAYLEDVHDYGDQRPKPKVKGNNGSGNSGGAVAETKVPYNVLVNLARRVLRTEARVREKKEDNLALTARIEEMEKKRQRVEERMKSMEKAWQDQLMHIQKCLAAAKTHPPPEIKFRQYDDQNSDNRITGALHLHLPINGGHQGGDEEDDEDKEGSRNVQEQQQAAAAHKLHPQEELCRLKNRFRAWKKEYRNQLREVQATFRKIGNSQPQKKLWWGRFS